MGPPAAPPRFQKAPAAPAAAHRQGSSRPCGPRAAKCVTTHHDAFPARASRRAAPRPRAPRVFSVPPPSRPPAPRAARSPPPRVPRCPLRPLGPGVGGGRRSAENLRFVRSSHDFKAPPRDATPGLLGASRGSHQNCAKSRRAAQDLKKTQLPSGHPGRRDFTLTLVFFCGKAAKSLASFLRIPLAWQNC